MELLIVIAPMLIVGAVGYFTILIQEWISDVRFYRRKTRREIRRSLSKVTSPTGEEQIEKVEKVDSSLRNNEEEMGEAKEAKEKQI